MSDLLIAAHETVRPFLVLADAPVPKSTNPPGTVVGNVNTILGWVLWGVSALAVVGILIVAAKMFTSFRTGEGSEHMGMLGKVLAGCILAASAGPLVNAFL
ncbi:hypothetical protein ACWC9H_27120 [Streptomyces sp. NPDC001251]